MEEMFLKITVDLNEQYALMDMINSLGDVHCYSIGDGILEAIIFSLTTDDNMQIYNLISGFPGVIIVEENLFLSTENEYI
jgi:hypothetical protein